jgi:hypothetical protein
VFDEETMGSIRRLEAQKHDAINSENFDLAKDLKMQIDNLKSTASQLKLLELQKQEAV